MYFIRVDLGKFSGLGHYSRINSIINYLKNDNYKIVIDKPIKNSFFDINQKKLLPLYKNHQKFLNEAEDAKLFLKLIKNKKNAIVIKDSYKLKYEWEKIVYKQIKKLIVIDDDYKLRHYTDFYINHNPRLTILSKDDKKILQNNNKSKCKFLLGLKFSMFNTKFNKKKVIYSDLVFYNGGSGNILVYKKIINRLLSKTKFKIAVIIGPFSKNIKNLVSIKNSKRLKIYYKPNNILNIIQGTKLFVSSAGISMFESSFLKIPTLLFRMNNNQNLNDTEYEKLGHYFILDKSDLKFTSKIAELILNLHKNTNNIRKFFKYSSLKLNDLKKNFEKNLLQKLK